MRLTEAMIGWNETTHDYKPEMRGKVIVVPWPDRRNLADDYFSTVGACDLHVHEMSEPERRGMLFRWFHEMVLRDGLDPKAVHEALLEIDEYRWEISPTIEGATAEEDEKDG